MTTIYLIRHAEAEGNLYRIAQGQANSSITDRGERQIQALARRFADIPIDAVYASDLYRTCATASAIYKPKGRCLSAAGGGGADPGGLAGRCEPSDRPGLHPRMHREAAGQRTGARPLFPPPGAGAGGVSGGVGGDLRGTARRGACTGGVSGWNACGRGGL